MEPKPLTAIPNRSAWLGLPVIIAVLLVLSLRGIENVHLGYPDADRILMDGVFIRDFIRDLPLTRIYDYTTHYYVQYPALSIGYHPPFFPLFEAIFNAVFGTNMWSSRLALVLFAIIGVTAWYCLILRIFDRQTAFWTALVLVTTPFVVKWTWYTMEEIPVLSMAMLTGYMFYRYTESENPRFLYATAVLFSLSVWTKQTALFLAIWFLLYLLLKGRLLDKLRKPHVWGAILVILLLLIPLAVLTIWLGDQNIEQSIMPGRAHALLYRLSWDNLKVRLITLYRSHLTCPVIFLSLTGAIWAIKKRDSRGMYFGLLILSTYVFFSYIVGKNDRYPIFWIPAFSLFAALPVHYLRGKRWLRFAFASVLAGTVVYQIVTVYARPQQYATGYDQAAAYVLQQSKSPAIFFDGLNDGYFIYFMRIGDPDRRAFVLRGDKLLSSSSIHYRNKLQIHAKSRKDIEDLFNRYGVAYIVVEGTDLSRIAIHKELRAYLREGPFRLEKAIPVEGTRSALKGQSLLVYRYLNAQNATDGSIELRLPVVGQTIKSTIAPKDNPKGK